MKLLFLFFLCIVISLPTNVYSQNHEAKSLQIGNKWYYETTDIISESEYSHSTYIEEIVGDTIISGKLYFKTKLLRDNSSINYYFQRADSSSIYQYSPYLNTEILIINFDTLTSSTSTQINKDTLLYWGTWRIKLEIYHQGILSQSSRTYIEGIGKISSSSHSHGGNYSYLSLRAAVLDNIFYGDSTVLYPKNISFSDSTLYFFQSEANPNYSDTTWLVNMSSEYIEIDSFVTNRFYSYNLKLLVPDVFGHVEYIREISLMHSYSLSYTKLFVRPFARLGIALSNPVLCPLCKKHDKNNFTDSLHIYNNSKNNPDLTIAIIGDATLDVRDSATQNKSYLLLQNYPNPFNPTTTIQYSIPVDSYSSVHPPKVTLKVFDVLGCEVATLVNKNQKAGNYTIVFNASSLTSGIYYYRLQSGKFTKTNKLILLK